MKRKIMIVSGLLLSLPAFGQYVIGGSSGSGVPHSGSTVGAQAQSAAVNAFATTRLAGSQGVTVSGSDGAFNILDVGTGKMYMGVTNQGVTRIVGPDKEMSCVTNLGATRCQ